MKNSEIELMEKIAELMAGLTAEEQKIVLEDYAKLFCGEEV